MSATTTRPPAPPPVSHELLLEAIHLVRDEVRALCVSHEALKKYVLGPQRKRKRP